MNRTAHIVEIHEKDESWHGELHSKLSTLRQCHYTIDGRIPNTEERCGDEGENGGGDDNGSLPQCLVAPHQQTRWRGYPWLLSAQMGNILRRLLALAEPQWRLSEPMSLVVEPLSSVYPLVVLTSGPGQWKECFPDIGVASSSDKCFPNSPIQRDFESLLHAPAQVYVFRD